MYAFCLYYSKRKRNFKTYCLHTLSCHIYNILNTDVTDNQGAKYQGKPVHATTTTATKTTSLTIFHGFLQDSIFQLCFWSCVSHCKTNLQMNCHLEPNIQRSLRFLQTILVQFHCLSLSQPHLCSNTVAAVNSCVSTCYMVLYGSNHIYS